MPCCAGNKAGRITPHRPGGRAVIGKRVTFRCTRKVRDRVRLAPDLPSSTSDVVEATEWYCDLLMLGRRPAYLVTHAPSLFTVLFPAAGASSPGSLGVAVRQHVREALA